MSMIELCLVTSYVRQMHIRNMCAVRPWLLNSNLQTETTTNLSCRACFLFTSVSLAIGIFGSIYQCFLFASNEAIGKERACLIPYCPYGLAIVVYNWLVLSIVCLCRLQQARILKPM